MNWKKTAIIFVDVVLATYLLLAITAFNKPEGQNSVCNMVKIDIKDGVVDGFLNVDEIKAILVKHKIYPLAKPMASIDIRKIEETLTSSPFVNEAQCYKTQSGHVCIQLTQRMPVVRIKALNGEDYYIDNNGGVMPNVKYCSDIMIATGHINRRYAQKVLTKVGNTILADKFWQNQVVQLNVLSDGTLEIVPRVGDHIVFLGAPVDIEGKLKRLEKFYKYGLSQAGWNKYSYINVAFENQIICKKKKHNNSTTI
ncbi:MAG: cell division protein FtsQ [Prevotellaceae bacterium]|nr:cell division protein FtsQ [Prevotellaceae bacterium]